MDQSTHYPQRPGEPDCAYYMRTGLCSFGTNCRFNHPPDRISALSKEDYPERVGQPECQFYLKTGTCKFGSSCKFHHPRDKLQLVQAARDHQPTQLNSLNLPFRPGEKDCAFYMRRGSCKYGVTCKFNHPDIAMQAFPLDYTGGVGYTPHWPLTHHSTQPMSIDTNPYINIPLHPTFPSAMAPPSPMQVSPGWNTHQGFLSMDAGQNVTVNHGDYLYGAVPPLQDPYTLAFPAATPFSPTFMAFPSILPSSSGPSETLYPERPGQPECQYFMKTGECRFGSACRFHHPRERNATPSVVFLGPTSGLPSHPGAPPCTFYAKHGYCKFGHGCKFDHPFSSLP